MASNCPGLGQTAPGVVGIDVNRPDLQVWIGSVWDKGPDMSNEANSNLCTDVTQSSASDSDSSALPYPPLSPSSLDAVQSMLSLSCQAPADHHLLDADENSTDFPPARTPGIEALQPPAVRPSPTFPSMVESLMTANNMDLTYSRESENPSFKPPFTPWNRAMLVMWALKACDEFECSRETFHLAIDFFDRYIASVSFNPKSDLALVIAGSVYISSKMESSSFPDLRDYIDKVQEISFQAEDIRLWELEVLGALKCRLSPVTPNNWLGLFLQKALVNMECQSFFLDGKFSQLVFINVARLIDISLMHMGCIKFEYKVIAATALYHFTSDTFISNVSGLSVDQLAVCIQWMNPMAEAIKRLEPCKIRRVPMVREDEFHTIQDCNFGIEVVVRLYLSPTETPQDENDRPEDLLPKLSGYLSRQAFEQPEVNRPRNPPMAARKRKKPKKPMEIPQQETRILFEDPRDGVTPQGQILRRKRRKSRNTDISEKICCRDARIAPHPREVIAPKPMESNKEEMSEEIPFQGAQAAPLPRQVSAYDTPAEWYDQDRSAEIPFPDNPISLLPRHIAAFTPMETVDEDVSPQIPRQDVLAGVEAHESSDEEINVVDCDEDEDPVIVIDDSDEEA